MSRDALAIMGAMLILGGVAFGFILADMGQGWVLWVVLAALLVLVGALYKVVE